MQERKPLAFSYVRFSTPEQAKGDSLRRQTDAAEAYAVAHGLDLSDLTLQDLGRSAFRGKNLQDGALSTFRRAVEDGDIPAGSYLLLESPDRLSRLPSIDATEALAAICKLGITVVTLDDGQEYDIDRLRKEFQTLVKWLLRAEVSHDESRKKGARVAAAWAAKRSRAENEKLTAICPHWLRLTADRSSFEVIAERAAIVRRVFDEALAGLGQERIAKGLNEEGIPTFGRGERWHKSTIAKLIRNAAVVGTYQPHKMVDDGDGGRKRHPDGPPVEDYYPAIIPAEDFAKLQARLGDKRAPYVRTGQTITNPLAGIARCGLCGSSMTQVVKGNGAKPRLVCSRAKVGAGCEYHSIPVSDIWAALANPSLTAEAPQGSDETRREWERLEAERYGAAEHVDNLSRAIAEGGPSAALRSHLAGAERTLADLEARSRALAERMAVETPNSVKRRLDALEAVLEGRDRDPAEVNTRLRENLSAVVVHPSNPAEQRAASVTLQWLHGGETSLPIGGLRRLSQIRMRDTNEMHNPFETANEFLRVHTQAEIDEAAAFPIRSEDGREYLISRFYREAFADALDALTFDGRCELTLYAADDNPRLIPTDRAERKNGPEFTFPLGRIMWNAGGSRQVQRKNTEGEAARDWTIKNTYPDHGKQSNRATRTDFLDYLRRKVAARLGADAGQQAEDQCRRALRIADAVHWPDDYKLTAEIQPKKETEQ